MGYCSAPVVIKCRVTQQVPLGRNNHINCIHYLLSFSHFQTLLFCTLILLYLDPSILPNKKCCPCYYLLLFPHLYQFCYICTEIWWYWYLGSLGLIYSCQFVYVDAVGLALLCYPKGPQDSPQVTSEVWPFLISFPLKHAWNPTILYRAVWKFCHVSHSNPTCPAISHVMASSFPNPVQLV